VLSQLEVWGLPPGKKINFVLKIMHLIMYVENRTDHDEQEEEEEYWDEVLLYGPDFQIILSPTDSAVIA